MCSFCSDVDLSCNQLAAIPETVYKIKSLRRLNFSQNCLTEVQMDIGNLDELVSLNLSRNKLLSLPVGGRCHFCA